MDTTNEAQSPHPSFLKGFNEGYLMSKYMPDIAHEISLSMKNTERGMGFKEGYSQYLVDKHHVVEKLSDKTIEQNDTVRMPDWLQIDEPEQHDEPSQEKEMDDREPELE